MKPRVDTRKKSRKQQWVREGRSPESSGRGRGRTVKRFVRGDKKRLQRLGGDSKKGHPRWWN